jgi:predicted RNase H-like nuclease
MAEIPRLVIGLDVGYSATRRTSGFLLASFAGGTLSPVDGPHALTQEDAVRALSGALRDRRIAAVAVDAPVASTPPREYRSVERVFSLGRFQTVCKPGSSGSPIGRALAMACHANLMAVAADAAYVPFDGFDASSPTVPVVEAFPTAAMAVLSAPWLLPEAGRSEKTDLFFEAVVERSDTSLAGVDIAAGLRTIINHEALMAVVCALVAAWFTSGRYTAIGNVAEGYFLMPAIADWHPSWQKSLRDSLRRERRATCVDGSSAPLLVARSAAPGSGGEAVAPAVVTAPSYEARPAKPASRDADHDPVLRMVRRPGATVQIGYINRNGQTVVSATGLHGTDHGQSIYVLRCGHCHHEYGSNGSDNFQRKCPNCQHGAAGLPYK